jgi:hypothetical protein
LQQSREEAFSEWLATAKEEAEIVNYDGWTEQIPPMPDFQSAAAQ